MIDFEKLTEEYFNGLSAEELRTYEHNSKNKVKLEEALKAPLDLVFPGFTGFTGDLHCAVYAAVQSHGPLVELEPILAKHIRGIGLKSIAENLRVRPLEELYKYTRIAIVNSLGEYIDRLDCRPFLASAISKVPTPAPFNVDQAPPETDDHGGGEQKSKPRALLHLAVEVGIKGQSLAEIMGCSTAYVSQIMSGRKKWGGLRPDKLALLRAELENKKSLLYAALALTEDTQMYMPEKGA